MKKLLNEYSISVQQYVEKYELNQLIPYNGVKTKKHNFC